MSTSDLSLKIQGLVTKKCRNEGEFKRTLSNLDNQMVADIRRKTNHSRMRSLHDLRNECIHEKKTAWKESGPINKDFSITPAFEPDIIDGWKAARIVMPERSYRNFEVSKVMKFPHTKGEFNDLIPLGNSDTAKNFDANDKKVRIISSMKDLRPPFNVKKADYDRKTGFHNTFLVEFKNRIIGK